MKTCAFYLRKSNPEPGDKQADRKSVAVQRAECQEFAKARSWRVVTEFQRSEERRVGKECRL